MPGNYNPKSAAAILGISTTTLRNYCAPAMFAEFLSSEATPPAGGERRLSDQDIAILQRIMELRAQGMTTDAIKQSLQAEDLTQLQPPYIDTAIEPVKAPEASQPAPLATIGADVFAAALQTIQSQQSEMQAQMEAMRAEQKDRMTWFIFGIIVGVLIVGIVAAIVLAGAVMR